ncbi:MAG: DMT family transporter [Gemmatimonadota bacterium]|nr:DMT family transporter [Gemmatimonadota bacterium]
MSGRAFSILLLLAAVLIWGSTYVITKTGVEEVPPMLFALLRYCVASLLLAPLALLRARPLRGSPPPPATLVLMGLTGVALYYAGFNLSLTYTTASQGALVQSSIPAVTAILAVVWLRERLSARRMLGIGLAIVGVMLVVAGAPSDDGARAPLVGNLLMCGTVLTWGVYTMLAKRVAGTDAIAVTAAVSVIGTVMLIPAALAEAAGAPTPAISADAWLRIIYLGALPSAAGYLLYNRALRDLDASQVGAFTNLSPVIGAVSGVVFLGETITPLAIGGGVTALVGVWMCR